MTVMQSAPITFSMASSPLKPPCLARFGSAIDPASPEPVDDSFTGQTSSTTHSASPTASKKDHGLFQPLVDLVDGVRQFFHDAVSTLMAPIKQIQHFLHYVAEKLNPQHWFKPETFHGQDERNYLTGALSPAQAAKELTPLTVGLSLETLPAYQRLTAPVEKGLRRTLSMVNQGSLSTAPHAPVAVMGLVGEQEGTKTRFAQALADIAFEGPSALSTVDLNTAASFEAVKRRLSVGDNDDSLAQVLLVQHADLKGNTIMSNADKAQTLMLLTQLVEAKPSLTTQEVLAQEGINLHNTLLVLSLDAHPLEAPKLNRLEGSPAQSVGPASVNTRQTMLLDKVRLEAPYWQAFTASGFAPLVDAQSVRHTVS